MPVYEFVKNYKSKNGENTENWKYKDWLKNNLEIELEENTSILNLAYQDTDKDIILPVLNQITNLYQKYSGENRNKNIKNALNYLDNQISIFKKKSLNSMSQGAEFSINNDLLPIKKYQ